jgi:hypothetical protein
MKRTVLLWTYKGVDVFRADLNSSGILWYARTPRGMLRIGHKSRHARAD